MSATIIELDDAERDALNKISNRTGKTEHELIKEAVMSFIDGFQQEDRLALLQQACGMWKDHADLPDFTALRNEADVRLQQMWKEQ